MGRQARWEYLCQMWAVYRAAGRANKGRTLDEVCEVTGYHRNYAVRQVPEVLLDGAEEWRLAGPRPVYIQMICTPAGRRGGTGMKGGKPSTSDLPTTGRL